MRMRCDIVENITRRHRGLESEITADWLRLMEKEFGTAFFRSGGFFTNGAENRYDDPQHYRDVRRAGELLATAVSAVRIPYAA